mmetsp:Transcript_21735/g.47636  ORF Transcript_21735/g.47636 Transcript_21735/m.47636 type:complete len:80 (+) Transcript_21735:400-639(+)
MLILERLVLEMSILEKLRSAEQVWRCRSQCSCSLGTPTPVWFEADTSPKPMPARLEGIHYNEIMTPALPVAQPAPQSVW